MTTTQLEKAESGSGSSMTQAERTTLSRSRMIDAAIDLIVRKGIEGMTLKEVGEAAGYSRGLAGYRFGSKKDLLVEIVHTIGDEWLAQMKPVTKGKVAFDAISAAVNAHYHFCRDAPSHVRAFYILWFESINPGSLCKDIIFHVHERRKKDIAAWVEQGISQGVIDSTIDSGVIADQFCSAIIGIVYHWLNNPSEIDEVKKLHQGLDNIMAKLLLKKS